MPQTDERKPNESRTVVWNDRQDKATIVYGGPISFLYPTPSIVTIEQDMDGEGDAIALWTPRECREVAAALNAAADWLEGLGK